MSSLDDIVYDDVVISGVGGYFPKCRNMEELKQYLFNNEELLGSRWKPGEWLIN